MEIFVQKERRVDTREGHARVWSVASVRFTLSIGLNLLHALIEESNPFSITYWVHLLSD